MDDIIRAIYNAEKAGVSIVEVDIKDLLILADSINNLKDKVRKLNISLVNAELCALDKPLRLNTFA